MRRISSAAKREPMWLIGETLKRKLRDGELPLSQFDHGCHMRYTQLFHADTQMGSGFIRKFCPNVHDWGQVCMFQGKNCRDFRAFTTYQALGTWMENNAYSIVGPRRKIRLRREDNLDDALTEIQFPVEKAP